VKFYSLNTNPDGDAETCVREEEGYHHGDAARCKICGAPTSMLAWLPPFRANLELFGRVFGDLAFLGASTDFLVSQKFRQAYYQAGLTGLIGFDPVEVLKVKSRRKHLPQPPMYFRVQAHYGTTALDLPASGMEWLERPTCDYCQVATIVRWKRLVVKDGTWSGEDIFRPRGMSGETMVSQRFKDACEQHRITNAYFTPAEESGYDFYPGMPPSESVRAE